MEPKETTDQLHASAVAELSRLGLSPAAAELYLEGIKAGTVMAKAVFEDVLAEATKALEPFAEVGYRYAAATREDEVISMSITLGELRAAIKALRRTRVGKP